MRRDQSHLLVEGTPSVPFHPLLAIHLGISTALVLQQMHYWSRTTGSIERDSYRWATRGAQEWVDILQCFDIRTVRNAIKSLEAKGLAHAAYLGHSQCKSYRIDYPALVQYLREVSGTSIDLDNSGNYFHLTVETTSTTYIRKEGIKNMVKPSAVTPEEHDTSSTFSPEKESKKAIMKIAKNSADIIASFNNQKTKVIAPEKQNTGASVSALWRDTVPKHNEVKMLPTLTTKQRGQFTHFARRCGPTADQTIVAICSRWVAFTKYVASAKGLKKTPDLPDIGFALLYLGEAMNFASGELQLVAASKSKTSILGSAKGVPLRIRPPKQPDPAPPQASQDDHETEKEGVASLEDILQWAPAKKE